VLLPKYYSGDQIEKNEIVGVCSTCGGEETCIQGFDGETWEKWLFGRPWRRRDDNIKIDSAPWSK
jgi:hypothetical protein